MDDMIRSLYYIVDERAGQQYQDSQEATELLARQDALREEIILRLGENGREMMEALTDLNLKLEDIHDEALFRAAVQLGAEITRPSPPDARGRGPRSL